MSKLFIYALILFRKKKLTNHWRNYIRPIMWRCKWMELRMKELDSQVSKYSRELESCDQGKPLEYDQFASGQFFSKSFSFSSRFPRRKAMKRRKRKRVEDTNDVASYMTQHNLFSYLGKRQDFILILLFCCLPIFVTLVCYPLQRIRSRSWITPVGPTNLVTLVTFILTCQMNYGSQTYILLPRRLIDLSYS